MKKWIKVISITILSLGLIVFAFTFASHWGSFKDTDYNHPPQFVTADFVDLSKIDTVSKYRSGVGHDYSGNGETCRSMRHYFGSVSSAAGKFKNGNDKLKALMPEPDPSTAVNIYSPTDGWISSISGEGTPVGKQMEIVADNGQGWHIRIDHVFPIEGIHILSRVKAGQLIGLIHDGQAVDMTVLYNYRGQMRLTSYFWVMTDEVFANYQARGIKSRDEFIIPKEVIDANPWKCLSNRKDTPDFAEDYSGTPDGDAFNNVHF
jgi:hypothetical protein